MSPAATWLRVVIYETRGDYGKSLAYLTAGIAEFTRVLEDQPGFVVAYWGHDPDDATIAAVSHWRSRAAITDAAGALTLLQAGASTHGIHVVHTQNLELFPVPVSVSMWTTDDDAGQEDKRATAAARHRFRLHR